MLWTTSASPLSLSAIQIIIIALVRRGALLPCPTHVFTNLEKKLSGRMNKLAAIF